MSGLSSVGSRSFAAMAASLAAILAVGCSKEEKQECVTEEPPPREGIDRLRESGTLPIVVGEFDTDNAGQALKNLSQSLELIVQGRQKKRQGCSRLRVENHVYWHISVSGLWDAVTVLGDGRWNSYPSCFQTDGSGLEDEIRRREETRFQFGAIYEMPGIFRIYFRDGGQEERPYTLSIPLYEEDPDCRSDPGFSNEFFASSLLPEGNPVELNPSGNGWEGVICSNREGDQPCDPPTEEIRVRLIPDPEAVLRPPAPGFERPAE